MSKRRGSHSKPDPEDPIGTGAQEAALDALMKDADALAKELGVEVGATGPERSPSSDPAVRPGDAPPDPLAQVEKVEGALAGAAKELGTAPQEPGAAAGEAVLAEPTGSHMAGLDPSEGETTDEGAPTITDDVVAVPGSAKSGDQQLSAATGQTAAAQTFRPEGDQDATSEHGRARLREMLRQGGALGSVTARVAGLVKGPWGRLDLSSETLGARVRTVFAWMDRPFRRVPLQARPAIGYLAILTLAMAMITFVVGWFR